MNTMKDKTANKRMVKMKEESVNDDTPEPVITARYLHESARSGHYCKWCYASCGIDAPKTIIEEYLSRLSNHTDAYSKVVAVSLAWAPDDSRSSNDIHDIGLVTQQWAADEDIEFGFVEFDHDWPDQDLCDSELGPEKTRRDHTQHAEEFTNTLTALLPGTEEGRALLVVTFSGDGYYNDETGELMLIRDDTSLPFSTLRDICLVPKKERPDNMDVVLLLDCTFKSSTCAASFGFPATTSRNDDTYERVSHFTSPKGDYTVTAKLDAPKFGGHENGMGEWSVKKKVKVQRLLCIEKRHPRLEDSKEKKRKTKKEKDMGLIVDYDFEGCFSKEEDMARSMMHRPLMFGMGNRGLGAMW